MSAGVATVHYERGTGGVLHRVRGHVLVEDSRVLVVTKPDGGVVEIGWRFVVSIEYPSTTEKD